MIIYIEGNIGAGKTTFVNNLKKYCSVFKKIGIDAEVVTEPVDEWMHTYESDGKNILEKFYEDQNKWSFCFQMNSFISRIKKINDAYYNDLNQEIPNKIIFVERSIYTDRFCFAQNCYETGKMTKLEYDVYCRWNDWLAAEFQVQPSAYIYIRCMPNVNNERIIKRSRDGESNIPIEYLQMLHNKHEEWMTLEKSKIPVLTIDAMEDFTQEPIMDKLFTNVYEFIEALNENSIEDVKYSNPILE